MSCFNIQRRDVSALEMACEVLGFWQDFRTGEVLGVHNGGRERQGVLVNYETYGYYGYRYRGFDRPFSLPFFFDMDYGHFCDVPEYAIVAEAEFSEVMKDLTAYTHDFFEERSVLMRGHYRNNFWAEDIGKDRIEFLLAQTNKKWKGIDVGDFGSDLWAKELADKSSLGQQLMFFDAFFTTEKEMIERFMPYLKILEGIFKRFLKSRSDFFDAKDKREKAEKERLWENIQAEERYKRKLWQCKAKSALRSKVTSKDTMSFFSNLELISK